MVVKFSEINKKVDQLKAFLTTQDLKVDDSNVRIILMRFLELKEIIGNLDMDIHFLVSYLADCFLRKKHGIAIDLGKAVGSSGLDIDTGGIAAEIKTTIPYHENDFGAKQKESVRKDLERLEKSGKKTKYFFVIDGRTEKILKQKYAKKYPTVKILNLLKEN